MKIKGFSEFKIIIPFTNPANFREARYAVFLESDLGKIYSAIPKERAKRLLSNFGIVKERFLRNRIKARSELTQKV